MSDLTDRVDRLLQSFGMTRYRLCRKLDIPTSTFQSWIRGSSPAVDKAIKMAEFFNVSLEYLVSGSNEPEEINSICMNTEEKNLIEVYRTLNKSEKKSLMDMALYLRGSV